MTRLSNLLITVVALVAVGLALLALVTVPLVAPTAGLLVGVLVGLEKRVDLLPEFGSVLAVIVEKIAACLRGQVDGLVEEVPDLIGAVWRHSQWSFWTCAGRPVQTGSL